MMSKMKAATAKAKMDPAVAWATLEAAMYIITKNPMSTTSIPAPDPPNDLDVCPFTSLQASVD